MTCLLRHPEVATRSCSECKKWVFDKQGKITTRNGRADGTKVPRGKSKTPCQTSEGCPKESPEKAHRHELSEKNCRAVELYFATRAMGGTNLSEDKRRDAIVVRNMAIIDRIVRGAENDRASQSLAVPILSVLSAAFPGGGR